MIINYKRWNGEADCGEHQLFQGKCLVDGREIRSVWFADTEEGIVKTYSVDGTDVIYAAISGWRHDPKYSPMLDHPDIENTGGVLSRTLRGRIELFEQSGVRIYP